MVNIGKTLGSISGKSISYYGDKEIMVFRAKLFFSRFMVRAYFQGIVLQMHNVLGDSFFFWNESKYFSDKDFWGQIKSTKARFENGNEQKT